jgi:hypothetical protein
MQPQVPSVPRAEAAFLVFLSPEFLVVSRVFTNLRQYFQLERGSLIEYDSAKTLGVLFISTAANTTESEVGTRKWMRQRRGA